MGKLDHSYYCVTNVEQAKKYFTALINGFGGCGGFNFNLNQNDKEKDYFTVPTFIDQIHLMEELLDEFLESNKLPKDNFKIWIHYQGPIATREYELMDDFMYGDLADETRDGKSFLSYAKLIHEQTQSFDPTVYIVTPPVKFMVPLASIDEMINVLALTKLVYKTPITKYAVLKDNVGIDEIRFFTMRDGAITMFILFPDMLHCCCVDNREKYMLDIDDGFVSVFGKPINWGEYSVSFNKWKEAGYSYKLKINTL